MPGLVSALTVPLTADEGDGDAARRAIDVILRLSTDPEVAQSLAEDTDLMTAIATQLKSRFVWFHLIFLINLLFDFHSSPSIQYKAAGLVTNLSAQTQSLERLAQHKPLIGALVHALRNADCGLETKGHIASVFSNLALSPNAQEILGTTTGALEGLFDLLSTVKVANKGKQPVANARTKAAGAVENLSGHGPNRQRIGKLPNVFGTLLAILADSDKNATPQMQSHVAGALANLAKLEENKLRIAPTVEDMVVLFTKFSTTTGSPFDKDIQV